MTWSDWLDLGSLITAEPAVTSPEPGRLECFVKSDENRVHHCSFDGQWGPWEDLSGRIGGAPAVTSRALDEPVNPYPSFTKILVETVARQLPLAR
jgi:hypothetical protein